YQSGSISAREAAEAANQMRNEIMEMARVRSSDLGRAKAQSLKAKGLDLDQLTTKYAQKKFGKDFASLTRGQQDEVLLEIVESAGRANPKVSARAGRMGALGRGLWVLTAVIAIYNISTAEHKVHAAGREAAGLGGGFAGGAAGGALAGVWFGPVGVAVGVIIGGVLGSLTADAAYIEITGPREARVRQFLPRFTSMFSTDEAGIANALIDEYGIDMDSVLAVFRELSNSYRSDSDDVARLYLAKVKDRGGALQHALRLHLPLRNMLILILDGGWTTDEEYKLIDYLKKL
ncbi:MAG: hypothetical protein KDK70_32700, partial [Myxococcales bacterium]|nr:hypothetical protein [Myxococcales bacterium]